MNERLVALAPYEVGDLLERYVPLHRADPAALRQDDGDRLALDHRRPVDFARGRDRLDPRAAIVAELLLQRGEVALEAGALAARAFEQPGQLLAVLGERAPPPPHF